VRAAALAVAPGARSLLRWLTSWRGREERLLELPASVPKRPPGMAPVLTLAPDPAPALRRDARVVHPEPESDDDRSSAAF